MTPEQLHILQHSLGCDEHGRSEHLGMDEGDGCMGYYRNRYISKPTPDLIGLCAMGFMEDFGSRAVFGGDNCYRVTTEGEKSMRNESPRPPKVSRSRARWLKWLKIADAFGDMTFGEYLKRGLYREVEK